MKQIDLIAKYWEFNDAARDCEVPSLAAHYTHILFALTMLIESHGPTPEYLKWKTICKEQADGIAGREN